MQFPNEAKLRVIENFATHQLQTQKCPSEANCDLQTAPSGLRRDFPFSKARGGLFFFISGPLKHFNPHHLCESMYEIRTRGKRESRGS